jgi:hypothetical protein
MKGLSPPESPNSIVAMCAAFRETQSSVRAQSGTAALRCLYLIIRRGLATPYASRMVLWRARNAALAAIAGVVIVGGWARAQGLNRDALSTYLTHRCERYTSASNQATASLAGHGISVAAFCACEGPFLTSVLTDQEIAGLATDPRVAEKLNENTDVAMAFCLGRLGH